MSEWIVHPESILRRALLHGMISVEEAVSPLFEDAANDVAEDLRFSWSEGEGFGSSDFTFLLQSFLRSAGCDAEFINGKLERIE